MIELLDTRYELAAPYWLLSLLLLLPIAWLRGRRSVSALVLPFSAAWKRSSVVSSRRLAVFLAYCSAICIAFALARPQAIETEEQSKNRGYDIMLVIDLSGSMYAEDYFINRKRVNRLEALKPVLSAFIQKRNNDRIGLIAFSGRAYTVSPLTFDHEWLAQQTTRLKIGLVEEGTAIGDAIAVANSRLLEGRKENAGEREGGFIVLLTDGYNESGLLTPFEGTDLAVEANIPIYTIAAGRNGTVPFPDFDSAGVRRGTVMGRSSVDVETLQEIAKRSGGEFFRAGESDTIERAFAKIDQASPIEFESNSLSTTTELFRYPLYIAGLLALASVFAGAGTHKEVLA